MDLNQKPEINLEADDKVGDKVCFSEEKNIFVQREWPYFGPEVIAAEKPIGNFTQMLKFISEGMTGPVFSKVDFACYSFPVDDLEDCDFLNLDLSRAQGVSSRDLSLARFFLAEKEKMKLDPEGSRKPYFVLNAKTRIPFDPNDFPKASTQQPYLYDDSTKNVFPISYISDLFLETSIDVWFWMPHAKDKKTYKGTILTRGETLEPMCDAAQILCDGCGESRVLLLAGNLCDSLEIASLFFQMFSFFQHPFAYYVLGPDELRDLSPIGDELHRTKEEVYGEYKKQLEPFGTVVLQDELQVGNHKYSADEVLSMEGAMFDTIFFGNSFSILGSTGDPNDVVFQRLYRHLSQSVPQQKILVLTSFPIDETVLPILPNWEYISGQKNDLSEKRSNVHKDGGIGFLKEGEKARYFLVKRKPDYIDMAKEGMTLILPSQYSNYWASIGENRGLNEWYKNDLTFLLKKEGYGLFAQQDDHKNVYCLDRGKRMYVEGMNLDQLIEAIPKMVSILTNGMHDYKQKVETLSLLMEKYFGGGAIDLPEICVGIKTLNINRWPYTMMACLYVDPITLQVRFSRHYTTDDIDIFYGSFEELVKDIDATNWKKIVKENGGIPQELQELFDSKTPELKGIKPDQQNNEERQVFSGKTLIEWRKIFRRLDFCGNSNLLVYFDTQLIAQHPDGRATMEDLLESFSKTKVSTNRRKTKIQSKK